MASLLIVVVPLLLLAVPVVIQVAIGKKLLRQNQTFLFWLFSLCAILLEILFALAGLAISIAGQQKKGIVSLSPGIISFGFVALVVLCGIILSQYFTRRT